MDKLRSYVFYAFYGYISFFTMSLTWQILNPEKVDDFFTLIIITILYGPGIILFLLATWLFWRSLRKNYVQSKY